MTGADLITILIFMLLGFHLGLQILVLTGRSPDHDRDF